MCYTVSNGIRTGGNCGPDRDGNKRFGADRYDNLILRGGRQDPEESETGLSCAVMCALVFCCLLAMQHGFCPPRTNRKERYFN